MTTPFKHLAYSMTTGADSSRHIRVTARLKIAGDEAVRLFNEQKVTSGEIRSFNGEIALVDMVVELATTRVAVFSARDSEMVRGDGFVVFLPMEADHRHRPDAYVGGLIEAVVNGEYVRRDVLDEVLGLAGPAEAVAEFREAMAKFEAK